MKRIAILCPSTKPVPAVRGGAIETIIDGLIKQNEITPKFEFTVFSEYDQRAIESSNCFKHTRFEYVKTNLTIEKYYYFLYRLVKKLFRIALPDNIARKKMVDRLDAKYYDWILFQAGEVFSLKRYCKKLPKEKVLVHAHGMITPIPSVDEYFAYYLAISDFVSEYWKTKSNREDRTYKIWKNCIYTEKFGRTLSLQEMTELKRKLNIAEDDFVVIFVGRIIPEKGVLELIQALNYTSDKKIKLLVIGSANFADSTSTNYEKLVNQEIKKHSEHIVFTGYVPNEELYKYYCIADISAVPSIWDEPAGLVVLEAMAAGKPVITTGSGGIKEYVDSEAAVFVNRGASLSKEIAEAIIRLMENEILRHKLGQNAYQQAQKYDMKNYLDRLEQILSELS